MHKPTFIVIGAARSGSTAVYEYLTQHPDVFMSEPKEPHYFAFPGERLDFRGPGDDLLMNQAAITDRWRYSQLFAQASGAKAVGEASVSYLYYPAAARRIKESIPGVKLVCVLRNPADRAFSSYMFMLSRLLEPAADFRTALADEDRRVAEGWHHLWHYRRMGYYHAQLKHYFDLFDRDQLRVYLYDDFRNDPDSVVDDCFRFIGVEPPNVPLRVPSPHLSGTPRFPTLNRFLMYDNRLKDLVRPILPRPVRGGLWNRLLKSNTQRQTLAADIREELMAGYETDIQRLEELLDRDLSIWRTGRRASAPPSPRSSVPAPHAAKR
jgi:hypothetical protein